MAEPITSDVFRFVSVRPPQQPTEAEIIANFVTYDFFDAIDPAVLAAIEASEPLLYTTLLGLAGDPDARNLMIAATNNFRSTSAYYIADKDALYAKFPKFNLIDAFVQQNKETITFANLKTGIETILGDTIANYVSAAPYLENKLRLWDNLFSYMIVTDNNQLREQIIIVIRLLSLFERINANERILKAPKGIPRAAEASIVMPKSIYPLPKIINDIPENPEEGGKETDEEKLIKENLIKLKKLDVAFKEVLDGVKKQYLDSRVKYFGGCTQIAEPYDDPDFQTTCDTNSVPNPDNDPLLLRAATYSAFSDDTKTILETYKVPANQRYAPYFFERINADFSEIGSKTIDKYGYENIVLVGGTLISILNLCHDKIEVPVCDPYTGVSLPEGSGHIKPIGVGDLLVVQQTLDKYELGEIAHIENILYTEKKERTHRLLNRVEESTTSETETINEQERDTQTTERFGLERETQNVVSSDTSLEAGITVSSYGVVNVSASANYATNNSSSQSNQVASNYAKSVTDRALSRIIERVRTVRTVTTIRESEETNVHGFDNTNPSTPSHVIGQYYWVDKIYSAKLINYGKRLMFEFLVPEPAAFHIYSKANANVEGVSLQKPLAPDADGQLIGKLSSYQDLTVNNFSFWAARYGATDVTPPPPLFKTIAGAFNRDQTPGNDYPTEKSTELQVPEGYEAKTAFVRYGYSFSNVTYIRIWVGRRLFQSSSDPDSDTLAKPMENETGIVPVTIQARQTYWAINIEIMCQLTAAKFDEWRLNTYNQIIEAYNRKLSEYNDALSAAQIQQGVGILGNNPTINRETEKTELKKGCIELLTDQKFAAFDAMRNQQPTQNYPEFRNLEAIAEGEYVKFFENAFEWTQMTYIFYPYFWGRKKNWVQIKQYDDADPLFAKFLQAGYARVLVPVRPSFEEAILYYNESGEIWNGEGVPTIDDDLFVSIVQEIKESNEATEGVQVGETWAVRVPTTLVRLDAAINPELPDYTTP